MIVVVLGMHRSGTSLVANLLHNAFGVNVGDKRLGKGKFNPYGLYEDLAFLTLNQRILSTAAGKKGDLWNRPPSHQRILGVGPQFEARIQELVAMKNARENWGWKDPRTCLTIGLYHEFLDDVRYIRTRRRKGAVIKSLEKRAPGRRGESFWNRLIQRYEGDVKEFLQATGAPYIDVRFEALTKEDKFADVIGRLSDFLELPVKMHKASGVIRFRDKGGRQATPRKKSPARQPAPKPDQRGQPARKQAKAKDESKYRSVVSVFKEVVLRDRELIWVLGYPRSGTTWLTRLLAQCLDSPSLSWATENDVRLPKYRDPAVEGLHRRGPYVVRHAHGGNPGRSDDAKTLVIFRDPRDVAVSCYHYFSFHRNGNGMQDCVAQMCGTPGPVLGFVNVGKRGWAGHTAAWLAKGAPWIRYEDLLADTEITILRAIEMLGLPAQPSERVRAAVEAHRFVNRRKDKTMRVGVAGSWSASLESELADRLFEHSRDVMQKLGYER